MILRHVCWGSFQHHLLIGFLRGGVVQGEGVFLGNPSSIIYLRKLELRIEMFSIYSIAGWYLDLHHMTSDLIRVRRGCLRWPAEMLTGWDKKNALLGGEDVPTGFNTEWESLDHHRFQWILPEKMSKISNKISSWICWVPGALNNQV